MEKGRVPHSPCLPSSTIAMVAALPDDSAHGQNAAAAAMKVALPVAPSARRGMRPPPRGAGAGGGHARPPPAPARV